MTGTDLKLRRIAAHVKAKDVAARAGWTSQRISQIEASHFVGPEHAGKYQDALAAVLADRETLAATITPPSAA